MAKYTRKFPVQLEGQAEPLFVASATCSQTERFLDVQRQVYDSTAEAKEKDTRLEQNAYLFIVDCLNNAGVDGAENWTPERVRAELDKRLIQATMDLAQKESGLTPPNEQTPSTSA